MAPFSVAESTKEFRLRAAKCPQHVANNHTRTKVVSLELRGGYARHVPKSTCGHSFLRLPQDMEAVGQLEVAAPRHYVVVQIFTALVPKRQSVGSALPLPKAVARCCSPGPGLIFCVFCEV